MFELTQPFLIERITISFLGIGDGKTNERLTTVGKLLLNKDTLGIPRKYDWEYRGAIGMLTYLMGSVRPDIAMATHQCARFSVNPMRSHEQAVIRIGRYLLSTKENGMIYRPDTLRGVEVSVDADFAGGWDPADALNADNIYSCTGYTICYAGCPIFWHSKLQTKIALSNAEADYIALSQALRETIPMTNLMREMNVIFPLHFPKPKFVLNVREDNQSCIAMTNNPKFTPRTKHITIKYHHFRKHVNSLIPNCNLAGTKKYPSVNFLRRNSTFFLVSTTHKQHHHGELPPPPAARILQLDPIRRKHDADVGLGEGVIQLNR